MLADLIANAHAANEAKLTAQVPRYDLDNEARQTVGPFVRFCADHGVPFLPAAPATVAAFVMGASPEEVGPTLMAVQELHDSKGLPSPVATAAVRSAISRILKLKPPRSWRKHEQLLFADLPPEIRAVVERREQQRDTELRRLQGKVHHLNEKELKP